MRARRALESPTSSGLTRSIFVGSPPDRSWPGFRLELRWPAAGEGSLGGPDRVYQAAGSGSQRAGTRIRRSPRPPKRRMRGPRLTRGDEKWGSDRGNWPERGERANQRPTRVAFDSPAAALDRLQILPRSRRKSFDATPLFAVRLAVCASIWIEPGGALKYKNCQACAKRTPRGGELLSKDVCTHERLAERL